VGVTVIGSLIVSVPLIVRISQAITTPTLSNDRSNADKIIFLFFCIFLSPFLLTLSALPLELSGFTLPTEFTASYKPLL
jgi:hypothetical protein